MKTTLPLALALLISAPAFGQWAKIPVPAVPRTADGQPNLSAPAPRLADGKPDLSGVCNPPAGYTRSRAKDSKDEVPTQRWPKGGTTQGAGGLPGLKSASGTG